MNMFENASDDFKAANPGLFEDAVDVGLETDDFELEREFQSACERWLVMRGYWRRTEGRIFEGPPERGYFLHLHQAVGNPLILDLLILGNDGRFLEVELKTETGAVKKFQKRLVKDSESAVLVRDLPAFVGAVLAWEKAGEKF